MYIYIYIIHTPGSTDSLFGDYFNNKKWEVLAGSWEYSEKLSKIFAMILGVIWRALGRFVYC